MADAHLSQSRRKLLERLLEIQLASERGDLSVTAADRALLSRIVSGNQSAATAKTVSIAAGSRGPKLLWLYAGPMFRDLAANLESPLAAVALDSSEIDELPRNCSLQEIAEKLIPRIRSIQPRGPYSIAGWCAAGVLGYEIAVQLTAAGETVDLVALVDSPNASHFRTIPSWRRELSKIRFHFEKFRSVHASGGHGAGWTYAMDRIRGFAQRRGLEMPYSPGWGQVENAWFHYIPPVYSGPVALLRPRNRPRVPDIIDGWRGVATGVVEYELAGDHSTMFREPNVRVLASHLNRLTRSQSGEIQSASVAL